MPGYYIGLMSGTSMDGIDAALVRFGDPGVDIVATHGEAYAETLRFAQRRACLLYTNPSPRHHSR